MTAPQNGGGQEVLKWFNPTLDPPSGTTTTVIKADPETILRLSVQGPKNDTTYSTNETINVGDGSITTRDYVKQKFSWKDNVCVLNYQNSHSEDTQVPNLGLVTKWEQTYTVQFLLSYAGDPPTAVKIPSLQIPVSFELLQNYPNPFNPVTTIEYSIPNTEYVVLTVYDILGRTIVTIVDKEQDAGRYILMFDASKLSSGMYFYTITAGNFKATKKLTLMK
jgi:hypothetical protein